MSSSNNFQNKEIQIKLQTLYRVAQSLLTNSLTHNGACVYRYIPGWLLAEAEKQHVGERERAHLHTYTYK
jgi:hypothetical protein